MLIKIQTALRARLTNFCDSHYHNLGKPVLEGGCSGDGGWKGVGNDGAYGWVACR